MLQFVILFGVSYAANLFSAFAGGGAGVFQLPALLFLGLPFGPALATHKIATVALGLGAFLRHVREHHIERSIVRSIILCGLPGVVLGALVILRLPDAYARPILGAITILLGCYSFFNPRLGLEKNERDGDGRPAVIDHLGLFLIGALNGSFSSGSGLMLTIWLILRWGLDYRRAIAYTVAVAGIGWNAAGALLLGVLGDVQWTWIPALLLGSLLGGYSGSHLAIAKGSKYIKRAFEAAALIIGIKLLI